MAGKKAEASEAEFQLEMWKELRDATARPTVAWLPLNDARGRL